MSHRTRERAKLRNDTALQQQRAAALEAAHAEAEEHPLDVSTWRPMYGTIVVHWHKAKTHVGSILMPQAAQTSRSSQLEMRPAIGTVLACGPGAVSSETGHETPMPVSVGDTVLFGDRTAVEFKQDGKTVYLMSQMNIYAVISRVAVALGGP